MAEHRNLAERKMDGNRRSGHGTNQVYIWDLTTGKAQWILQGHIQWIARLQFSPDSEHLLASHHADSLHNLGPREMVVWKVKTGELAKYYQCTDWSLAKDGNTLAAGWPNPDPDNRTLAIRYKGYSIAIADFPSHKVRRKIIHPSKYFATCCAVSRRCDGRGRHG